MDDETRQVYVLAKLLLCFKLLESNRLICKDELLDHQGDDVITVTLSQELPCEEN